MTGKRKATQPNEPDPQSGLTDEIRAGMVQRFAMGCGPQAVANWVNEEYGLSIHKVQANRYNPRSASARRDMGEQWIKLYDECHERYINNVVAIPMADKTLRLQELQGFYESSLARIADTTAEMRLLQGLITAALTPDEKDKIKREIRSLKSEIKGDEDKSREILDQISKEVGNVNTNERVIKGKLAVTSEPEQLSMEEMRNLLADRIAESFEKNPVKPAELKLTTH